MARPLGLQKFNPPGRQLPPAVLGAFVSYGPYSAGPSLTIDLDSTVTVAAADTSGTTAIGFVLPDPTTVPKGRRILIQDIGGNAAAENMPITTNGTATIHGDVLITTDYGAREYVTNGTDWFLCGIVT